MVAEIPKSHLTYFDEFSTTPWRVCKTFFIPEIVEKRQFNK